MELLQVSNIFLNIEGIQILSNIDMIIKRGAIHAVIGPNGSGKTSLINCMTGYYRPNQGSVFFKKSDITFLKPHKIARLGISRMFQQAEIVQELSVMDNMMLGRHIHFKYSTLQALLFYGKARREEGKHRQAIENAMGLLQIEEFKDRMAGSLPYGTQKRIELARAIVEDPEILILDEPTSGMTHQEKEEIIRAVLTVHEKFIPTVILIEHDMRVVMKISDHVSVMNFGKLIAEGSPQEIQQNSSVIEAYLGSKI